MGTIINGCIIIPCSGCPVTVTPKKESYFSNNVFLDLSAPLTPKDKKRNAKLIKLLEREINYATSGRGLQPLGNMMIKCEPLELGSVSLMDETIDEETRKFLETFMEAIRKE